MSNKNTKKNVKKIKKIKKINSKRKSRKSLVIFIIILIFLLIGGLAYFLFTSDRFNVEYININGDTIYTQEEIISASNVEKGKNIFLIKSGKKSEDLLPYVESLKVEKKYPNTININVTKREAIYFAYDKEKNIFYNLSADGTILETVDENKKVANQITVQGIVFSEEFKYGDKIGESELEKIQIFDKIKAEYDVSGINMKITSVNFENSLTTIALDDKLKVVFPNDTNVEYNVSFLKSIIDNISDKAGIIDMTKDNPTFSEM